MDSTPPECGRPMRILNVLHRIGHIAMWRYIHRVHPLADRLSLRWGRAARLLRWPLPAMAPYRRRRLDVVRPMALGDILMCTPALREVKRLNPACRVTFYTGAAYQDLAASCPFVDAVRPAAEAPPDAVWMLYETAMAGPSASPTGPCRRTAPIGGSSRRAGPLARILGDRLGVDVKDIRPSCPADPAEVERFRRAWEDLPRPRVLVTREAGDFTRNKDWPDEYWEALLDRMLARCTIIEVGASCREGSPPAPGPRHVDLVGRTTLPQFDGGDRRRRPATSPRSPGPSTSPPPWGRPSVVIYGGYERPDRHRPTRATSTSTRRSSAPPAGSARPAPTARSACTRSPRTRSRPRSTGSGKGVADRTRAGRPSPRRSARGSRPPGPA